MYHVAEEELSGPQIIEVVDTNKDIIHIESMNQ